VTPETFHVARPFDLLIADTGIPSPTKATVGAVRERWQRDPDPLDAIFDQIGAITREARAAIESGNLAALGLLMSRNQTLLRQLGVSSLELERLIEASAASGAQGAKLSGGGGGGNMIALVAPEDLQGVQEALAHAGAVRVLHAVVSS
jgi:mevalonate kinase